MAKKIKSPPAVWGLTANNTTSTWYPASHTRYTYSYQQERKEPKIDMPPEGNSAGMKEIRAQIALGTLTNPKTVADVVKECDDPKVLAWAKSNKYSSVRAAAVGNPRLACGEVLKMLFFDKTKGVKMAAAAALGKHHHDTLCQLLDQFVDFPQYSLPLGDVRKDSAEDKSTPADIHPDILTDAVQRFRAVHARQKRIPSIDEYVTDEEIDDFAEKFEDEPF